VTELFGLPIETVAVALTVALCAAVGAIAVLALRRPVLVRISLRNATRRRGRSALIIVGLMLGTTIITAALATGDTMSHTIRSMAVDVLGQTDEVVAARGVKVDATQAGAPAESAYLDERAATEVAAALQGSGLVDGITPAIVEPVAAQSPSRGRTEPRLTLFAPDPARMLGFGEIRSTGGQIVSLAELGSGEVFLDEEAADGLDAAPGDVIDVFAGAATSGTPLRVRDIVRYDGTGSADGAVLMPLAAAQRLLGQPGGIRQVLVSNNGDATSGAALTDQVLARLAPTLEPLGLEAQPAKQDAIDAAEETGSAFMSFFTTFGTFSIAAGILLIFLIFVMLAAERRSELGIARAIGTRRGHLVELFLYEGAAYDAAAALVGALLGAAVAYVMVTVMAGAMGEQGIDIQYAVQLRSLLIGYAIGMLLTLAVVALSARRVSVMTIAAAIRNLPETRVRQGRRRWLTAGVGLTAGALLTFAGVSSSNATPLMLGISLVLLGLIPVARLAGASDRIAFTSVGLALVAMWMLPWKVWEDVFGPLHMDFTTWIAAGLMVVIGAVWAIVYNADLLLRAVMAVFGRSRRLAPLLRISIAYPLASRFRTGTTLAMFTLVVFTIVTGTASSGSFIHAFSDVETFGGGFDVRATTRSTAPIDDLQATLQQTPGVDAGDFPVVGSQSVLPAQATQVGTGRPLEDYPVLGFDASFLDHTTYRFGALATGFADAGQVWSALERTPNLAVVDSTVVPRRDNFGFAVLPTDFRITGFYYDDGTFDPFALRVRDPQTGSETTVTVIGVLAETVPLEMAGIWTSQGTLAAAFPGRARPTVHYLSVAPGVDPDEAAAGLESAFLATGMEAESYRHIVDEATAASLTFNRMIEGFMGLGLVVGVAALGVISARAVVERRQQIGVLRALGFRRGMVEALFLLESSFIALTSIVVGTILGLWLAYNIIDDTRRQPSYQGLTLVVPWAELALVFVAVYAVALLATLAPALRASRLHPAEALRYE
jgi:putative ABC transport system permease protein